MNESKNPNLHWFQFSCGSYNVGTWATSQRAAKAKLRPMGYPIVDKPRRKFGMCAIATIVV